MVEMAVEKRGECARIGGISRVLWENKSGAGGAGNTTRRLTRSSDLGREGLGMKPTYTPPAAPTLTGIFIPRGVQ